MRIQTTVIIPAHNHVGLTLKCLNAVRAKSGPGSWEIVVVDAGSTDSTSKKVKEFDGQVRVVRLEEANGFSTVANAGAAAAQATDYLVFLNNDTQPCDGWLEALEAYLAGRPRVAVVGSKLLYPNGTIQHAGVAIGVDGTPRHIYSRFPADHPAVNRSRRFQAVTGASCLVRRSVFEAVGGFDPIFRNGYEDVDLCLRIGRAGHGVHYCHGSVVVHLESASRGQDAGENHRLFKERWGASLRSDELDYYLADGLLSVRYIGQSPSSFKVSPLLGGVDQDESEAAEVLRIRSRQVSDLLEETTRLTAHLAEVELGLDLATVGASASSNREVGPKQDSRPLETGGAASTSRSVVEHDNDLAAQLYALQQTLAAIIPRDGGGPAFKPSPRLGYQQLVRRVRDVICAVVPPGNIVAVISHGDEDLVGSLPQLKGRHFPASATNADEYAGFHPADSNDAMRALEHARNAGAGYLVIPETSAWWLEHYEGFRSRLLTTSNEVARVDGTCRVYRLLPPMMANEAPELYLEIDREIHPHDEMYAASPQDYFTWGMAAVQAIERAIALVGAAEPRNILDLPCGHGRVLRVLRARYPQAELAACDLLRDGVDFCAQKFSAKPIYSEDEGTRIELQGPYDLIWCGSLLTHLPQKHWTWFLKLFEDHLAERGVLVFTTHGPHIAEKLRDGSLTFPVPSVDRLIQDFEETGFAYQDYVRQRHYGISLSSPKWVAALIARATTLRTVDVIERGWYYHHDVAICVPGGGRS
jgi:GT2 family glycosyltransferase/cyclopropane fatty-acyl-phospholipid synthase-like methyltransferase